MQKLKKSSNIFIEFTLTDDGYEYFYQKQQKMSKTCSVTSISHLVCFLVDFVFLRYRSKVKNTWNDAKITNFDDLDCVFKGGGS